MKRVVLSMAFAALVNAQQFEVVSIRSAKQDGGHDSDTEKGLWKAHNLSLKRLIGLAWGIDTRQVSGGPNWLDSDSYDIMAKIPAEYVDLKPSREPEMLQNMLADRFRLTVHREQRQISGLALVAMKKGPAIPPAAGNEGNPGIHSNNTKLTARNVTMEDLARHLSRDRNIGLMVIDKTGMSGRFSFELDLKPEQDPAPGDLPPIFRALQDKLGLKLESAKVPIEAVVVEHAEKPEAN